MFSNEFHLFLCFFLQKIDWIQNKLERPFFKIEEEAYCVHFDIEVVFPGMIKKMLLTSHRNGLSDCPKQ